MGSGAETQVSWFCFDNCVFTCARKGSCASAGSVGRAQRARVVFRSLGWGREQSARESEMRPAGRKRGERDWFQYQPNGVRVTARALEVQLHQSAHCSRSR